jgi:hypothetical protein
VKGRDRAMRLDAIHRLEFRQDVNPEAKQPGDVSENQMDLKDGFRRHVTSYCV